MILQNVNSYELKDLIQHVKKAVASVKLGNLKKDFILEMAKHIILNRTAQDDKHFSNMLKSLLTLKGAKMQTIADYLVKQGQEQGHQNGFKEGLHEGAKKEKYECARKMLHLGIEPKAVSQATNLAVEEITELLVN